MNCDAKRLSIQVPGRPSALLACFTPQHVLQQVREGQGDVGTAGLVSAATAHEPCNKQGTMGLLQQQLGQWGLPSCAFAAADVSFQGLLWFRPQSNFDIKPHPHASLLLLVDPLLPSSLTPACG